jgi:type II secretory pathway pseudopilin PulG
MKPVSWGKAYAILTGMKRRNSAGYTILEVMIVLAVTTALFVGVAVLFGGRQGQTQTEQSVRDLESKIQNITNDVATGYFPNGIKCTATSTPADPVVPSAAPATAGSNSGCIFLGKIASFANDKINLLSIVGRQFTGAIGNSSATSSLGEAVPVAVQINPESYSYNYGLKPIKIYDMANDTTQYGAIAFMNQLGGGSGGASPLTGSRSILLYGITGTVINDSIGTASGKAGVAGNYVALTKGARICLLGGNGKRAEITVGAGGGQVGTNVTIDKGVSSACAS